MTMVHIILLAIVLGVACFPVVIALGAKSKDVRSYRLRVILFGSLVFVSVVAVGVAFLMQPFLGMFIYDSNFQTFTALSAEQRRGIELSVDSAVILYMLLLVITNLLWIVGAWFLLLRSKPKEGQTPSHEPAL